MRSVDPHTAVNSRYGQAILTRLPKLNATLETLLSHRSIRHFLEAPLPPNALELLIAAAQSAPTSSNLQMWSVVAIEDGARKARLAQTAGQQAFIKQAPLLLVFLADMAILANAAQARRQPLKGIEYFDTFLMAALDAGLAAQNALTAAESMGFGAVFVGAIRNQPEIVIAELMLPEQVFPIVGLCIGYPDPTQETRIKPRLPQSAVLHREQYSDKRQAQAIAVYDEVMRDFYSVYRKDGACWSEQAFTRLRGVDTLVGRDRLLQAVHNQKIQLK
ncbi:MAG: NADPH-dependent oxidoreductase [Burkholderiales bacterium]|jgi:nitroreductase|nr:NADPH-dependent oxidoreductase [Burkholderiales bacterium]